MSSPLERYLAYKESKGLSETAATVTKPQNYNVRSGGVSAREKATIDKIREQQAKTREANRIQQEKFWRITTAKKEDVPKIILSQPDAPNTSKGNMAQYFGERGIDPLRHPVKPDWLTPQKQTELREKLKQESQQEIIEKTPPYVSINLPQEARTSPRGASPQVIIESPKSYTQPESIGRIETPEPLQNSVLPEQFPEQVPEPKSETISEMLPLDWKIAIVLDQLKIPIAIAALGIVGFFVIRRMKK